MIVKHARHFLTSQGQDYFSAWVRELNKKLSQIEGFAEVRYGDSAQNPEQKQLMMCFYNEEGLRRWLCNPEHEEMLDKLEPYMTRDWQVEEYRLDHI